MAKTRRGYIVGYPTIGPMDRRMDRPIPGASNYAKLMFLGLFFMDVKAEFGYSWSIQERRLISPAEFSIGVVDILQGFFTVERPDEAMAADVVWRIKARDRGSPWELRPGALGPLGWIGPAV